MDGVEARPDLRVGVQILPERQAEDLPVGGLAHSDIGKEHAPGVGKAAADALEIQAETLCWIEQALGGLRSARHGQALTP